MLLAVAGGSDDQTAARSVGRRRRRRLPLGRPLQRRRAGRPRTPPRRRPRPPLHRRRSRADPPRGCPHPDPRGRRHRHPWLRQERTEILAGLPPAVPTPAASKAAWERWQAGLSLPITLPAELPLRQPPAGPAARECQDLQGQFRHAATAEAGASLVRTVGREADDAQREHDRRVDCNRVRHGTAETSAWTYRATIPDGCPVFIGSRLKVTTHRVPVLCPAGSRTPSRRLKIKTLDSRPKRWTQDQIGLSDHLRQRASPVDGAELPGVLDRGAVGRWRGPRSRPPVRPDLLIRRIRTSLTSPPHAEVSPT